MSAVQASAASTGTPRRSSRASPRSRAPVTVSFTPMLAPMSRGILATCTAPARAGVTARPCARRTPTPTRTSRSSALLPEGQWPATAVTLGANTAHLQVALDERAGRVVVGRRHRQPHQGRRRAAVQSANLALGLPEETGPDHIGVAP